MLLSQEVLAIADAVLWLKPLRTRRIRTCTLKHCRNVAKIPTTGN
ncbi:Uncharacterised protein [Vibrio cholerae]|nr:Uncharacterised protein [Vibrio cholerae]